MSKANPFDYVESIKSSKKQNIITTSGDPVQAERDYNPFLANRYFSFFPELLVFVNELNKYNQIDKKLQYEFLLYLVRPTNRWVTWEKKIQVENLDLIQRYYNYNTTKALTALSILSEGQVATIRAKLDQGGVR